MNKNKPMKTPRGASRAARRKAGIRTPKKPVPVIQTTPLQTKEEERAGVTPK